MRIHLDPPAGDWHPRDASYADSESRRLLLERSAAHARRLGTSAPKSVDPAAPLLATGHQAFLWHPGILAKDLALQAHADAVQREASGATVNILHLIVDQDVHDVYVYESPGVDGDTANASRDRLGASRLDVPTGSQPAIELNDESWRDELPPDATLAEQAALTLHQMKQWAAGLAIPVVFTSDLATLPAFDRLVAAMADDAEACVRAYNDAARALPEAGITPLLLTREQVELPLWSVSWNQPRQRVYADEQGLADQSGNEVDRATLRPRALAMTALLRHALVDLFIHGTGGAVYDRVMEDWLARWNPNLPNHADAERSDASDIASTLAPAVAATADLTLDLAVPTSEPADLRRAIWYRHHLPHNVDRALKTSEAGDGPLIERKREILTHMDDDRDPRRRARLFGELHGINAELTKHHARLIEQADAAVAHARVGLENRRLLHRRDWPFFLYPPEQLVALRDAIQRVLS